jgi:lipopolysaccharide biosynthesis regulator YciM
MSRIKTIYRIITEWDRMVEVKCSLRKKIDDEYHIKIAQTKYSHKSAPSTLGF